MTGVFVNFLPLLGGDHVDFDDNQKIEEYEWAHQHALGWALQKSREEIPYEEAQNFAGYFAEGWLQYLKDESESIDASMRNLLRQYRKETIKNDELVVSELDEPE